VLSGNDKVALFHLPQHQGTPTPTSSQRTTDHDDWLIGILDQAIEISEEVGRALKQDSSQTKDMESDQDGAPYDQSSL
jgi:hypothetical protein